MIERFDDMEHARQVQMENEARQ
jgi:hypothetical protein